MNRNIVKINDLAGSTATDTQDMVNDIGKIDAMVAEVNGLVQQFKV